MPVQLDGIKTLSIVEGLKLITYPSIIVGLLPRIIYIEYSPSIPHLGLYPNTSVPISVKIYSQKLVVASSVSPKKILKNVSKKTYFVFFKKKIPEKFGE